MSLLSEKIRAAIYTALNVSSVTSKAVNGIHYMVAPDGLKPPFVVFNRIPVGVGYALGDNLVYESDRWLIKAVTDEDSSPVASPAALAEQILASCESAIGGSLTLFGNICHMARRVSEIPNYIEPVGDRSIYHHGFILETFAN